MVGKISSLTKRDWLIALGALTLISCAALPRHLKARNSALWPQTKGVITVSSLEQGYFKELKGYYGNIEYDYSVGDTRYHGTRLSFNKVHLAVEDAWRPVMDRYPVGKPVAVYYDPANPNFAILEPGLHGEVHDTFILAIVIIGLFVAAFLWVLTRT